MKHILIKIYMLVVCGFPKEEGNYSRFYAKDKNWIFQAGCFRSLIIGLIDRDRGEWASHPIARFLEEAEERDKKRRTFFKRKYKLNK